MRSMIASSPWAPPNEAITRGCTNSKRAIPTRRATSPGSPLRKTRPVMRGIALTAVLPPKSRSRGIVAAGRSREERIVSSTARLLDCSTRVVVAEEDILQTRRGKEQVDDVVSAGQKPQQRDHAAFERDHDPATVALQNLDPREEIESRRRFVDEGHLSDTPVTAFQIVDGLFRDDLPVPNDRHPLARPLDLGQIVRGHEDGDALVAQVAQHFFEGALNQRVEPIGWLVEHQQRGIGLDGRRQRQFLLHPLGVGVEATVERILAKL